MSTTRRQAKDIKLLLICKNCKGEDIASRSSRKFCSDKCRAIWHINNTPGYYEMVKRLNRENARRKAAAKKLFKDKKLLE